MQSFYQHLIPRFGLAHTEKRHPQMQVSAHRIQGIGESGAGEGREAQGPVDCQPQLPGQHKAETILTGQVHCPLGHDDGIGDKHPAVVGLEIVRGEIQAFKE